MAPKPLRALALHRRRRDDLPGEASLVSSAMGLDNLVPAQQFFDLGCKASKARAGAGMLNSAESERALRAARVL